ncbi:MAG: hypothetical protein FJX67_16070 [Alphaproteobacteria bacterium]|nr:hypothetical protein [Alphaproteobacteria bacterium]
MEPTRPTETTTARASGSSDRGFGLVMAAVFAIIGVWPALFSGPPRLWSLAVAALFLAAAGAAPRLLAPLNRLWTRFGVLLHRVMNPVVMAIVFYGTVVPIGLVMRALGKDPLRLRRDRAATTYWIAREPPGPAPETMKNQF